MHWVALGNKSSSEAMLAVGKQAQAYWLAASLHGLRLFSLFVDIPLVSYAAARQDCVCVRALVEERCCEN